MKAFVCFMFAVSMALYSLSITMADGIPKGKLGYGFESGLVAGKDFVEGQLIVGIKEGMGHQGIRKATRAAGGREVKRIPSTAALLEFPSEQAVADAVAALVKLPNVAFVERNGFMSIPPEPEIPDLRNKKSSKSGVKAQQVSKDPGTGYQWHHTVIRKTAALPALSLTPPTVAVIDTGVDYTHPDLSGKVILGKNSVGNNFDPFDDNGHGTHVAGIVAAKANNKQYGEGVCPNAKILAVKVLGGDGSGTSFDVADGMHYAHTVATVPPAKVINMSLGGSASDLIALEVDHIRLAGKVLVAAAGNSNSSTVPSFPGADPNTALRVMATEENDSRAFFSNFSPAATPTLYNIVAPGWEIPSTTPGAEYESLSGTSMASPVVAGAAALVWGQLPALTRDQLVARLIDNGEVVSKGFAAATRRVDVRRAILGVAEAAIVGRILDPFTAKAPSSPLTPTNARLFVGAVQAAIDGTNTGGSYEMTGLTPGIERILKGDRAGYVNTTVRTGITIGFAGPFTDALPKAMAAGYATITIDWLTTQPITDTTGCIDGCNGWDFDLFVKLPDGTYIGEDNPGDLLTSPFVRYARDSSVDLEPLETIVIGNQAADGIYRVFADKWPVAGTRFNPSWTGSGASAQIFSAATSLAFYGNPPVFCIENRYWHIGNLTKNGNNYVWANVNVCVDVIP